MEKTGFRLNTGEEAHKVDSTLIQHWFNVITLNQCGFNGEPRLCASLASMLIPCCMPSVNLFTWITTNLYVLLGYWEKGEPVNLHIEFMCIWRLCRPRKRKFSVFCIKIFTIIYVGNFCVYYVLARNSSLFTHVLSVTIDHFYIAIVMTRDHSRLN